MNICQITLYKSTYRKQMCEMINDLYCHSRHWKHSICLISLCKPYTKIILNIFTIVLNGANHYWLLSFDVLRSVIRLLAMPSVQHNISFLFYTSICNTYAAFIYFSIHMNGLQRSQMRSRTRTARKILHITCQKHVNTTQIHIEIFSTVNSKPLWSNRN